jgi:hypothetical protein
MFAVVIDGKLAFYNLHIGVKKPKPKEEHFEVTIQEAREMAQYLPHFWQSN